MALLERVGHHSGLLFVLFLEFLRAKEPSTLSLRRAISPHPSPTQRARLPVQVSPRSSPLNKRRDSANNKEDESVTRNRLRDSATCKVHTLLCYYPTHPPSFFQNITGFLQGYRKPPSQSSSQARNIAQHQKEL